MAQNKQSPIEFIQDAFSPTVAVCCSHDAELVCQKNNLTFVELTQPFCKLTTEGKQPAKKFNMVYGSAHIRDTGNISHAVHNLKVIMRDMNSGPPQLTFARKMLNDVVGNALPVNFDLNKSNVMTVGSYDLQISANTPWFEAYRDSFLQVLYPSDHEFLRHYLACIFVVSSSHADPMDQFSKLAQQQGIQQHQHPNKLPRWFCPNVLRYYVLVHDVVCEEEAKAEAIYQSMKSTYGVNSCHLLQINSRSPNVPDPNPQSNLPDPWSKFVIRKTIVPPDPTADLSPVIDNALEVTEETEVKDNSTLDHPLADPLINNSDNQSNEGKTNITDVNPKSNQHGCCLSLSDHDRLRIFIHEFIVRGLIPWAERTLRILNEQVMTRKSVGRSIFHNAKSWFGGKKPTQQNQTMESTNVVYTLEAPEMQARRLADLAFMFQLYEMAYQTYHACKRDFNNDHAWLHHAGAQEMAGISILMQGSNSQRQYPNHYLENAMQTYLSCKLPHFATRAVLLNTEALKQKQQYQEAALQFIKMTSEDSDLRSALLLEQAAHCFLRIKQPMVRKYSFHMVLAGHRFSKSGQRRHALRAYTQALQVFKGKQWSLAEDHINFTIGRQSFNLKQLENATLAFKHVLSEDSKQPAPQQSAFLREYLFIYKQVQNQSTIPLKELQQLPLPVVDGNATKVLCSHPHSAKAGKISASSTNISSDETVNPTWQKLEELMIVTKDGSLPVAFKPSAQCYTSRTSNTESPMAVIGEQIQVEVTLVNPMKVSLVLSNILLLWQFIPVHYGEEVNQESIPQPVSNEVQSNKNTLASEIVDTQHIPELILQASETKKMQLSLQVHKTGKLQISGLAYNLGTSTNNPVTQSENQPNYINSITVRGKINLESQGPRLNTTKLEKSTKMYGVDRHLDLVIVPSMPRLEVHFCDFPQSMLQGEVKQINVEFTNTGKVPLKTLQVACTHPAFITFGKVNKSIVQDTMADVGSVYNTLSSDMDEHEFLVKKPEIKFIQQIKLEDGVLRPGGCLTVPVWIYGPCNFKNEGSIPVTPLNLVREFETHLLFMYESADRIPQNKMRFRVLRHTVQIQLQPSLQLHAAATHRKSDNEPSNSLFVSLGVQNLNNQAEGDDFEFSLLQVSCVSSSWHLNHLTTQKHSDVSVRSKESTLMNFLGHKCKKKMDDKDQFVFSNVTFDQHPIDSSCTPCSDLFFGSFQSKTFEALDVDSLTTAAKAKKEEIKAPVITEKAQLENSHKIELSLIVLWKVSQADKRGSGSVIVGQHQVSISEINKTIHNPMLVTKQVEQPPVKFTQSDDHLLRTGPSEHVLSQLVRYSLSYKHHVINNFQHHRMCTVPVTLTCINSSPFPLKVQVLTGQVHHSVDAETIKQQTRPGLQMHSSSEPPSATTVVPMPRHLGSFLWSSARVSSLEVDPYGSTSVTLHACFCKSGIYNISTLQVRAQPAQMIDGQAVTVTEQKATGPSLIVISNSEVGT